MTDEIVGQHFAGHGRVYLCDSYDPSCGYWMTPLDEGERRTNVSERAIGRTFHRLRLSEDGGQWLGRGGFRAPVKASTDKETR